MKSRDLKYRYYNTAEKKMVYFTIEQAGAWLWHDIYIMEFSGIPDSKGRDIYERDIIWAYDLTWDIIFHCGRFMAFRPGKCRVLAEVFQQCEIIGNKDQNPKFMSVNYYLKNRKDSTHG